MTLRLSAAFAAFSVSFVAVSLLYRAFVLPELPHIKYVPFLWWVGCASPVILVGLACGSCAGSFRELVGLAALGCLAYLCISAFGDSRGHDPLPFSAAGILHRAIGFALFFGSLLGLVGIGWLPRYLSRRRRAA